VADTTAAPIAATPTSPKQPPTARDTVLTPTSRGAIPASAVPLSTTPPEKKGDPHPWKVKSISVSFGVMPWNSHPNSDLHIRNEANGTDLTIENAAGHQRRSFSYLYSMPNGYPQLDEAQSSIGTAVQFQNRFGVEANFKHNKYVITSGDHAEDPDQLLNMHGTWQGQDMNGPHSLQSIIPAYQITKGNYQASLMGTYTIPLTGDGNGKGLSLTTKAGPSLYMGYVKSAVRNTDGTENGEMTPFKVQGFGGTVENTLRYEFGRGWGVQASHALSVAHLNNIVLSDGSKVTQNWGASQVSIGISKTFGFK
jgi:hypothetical protein